MDAVQIYKSLDISEWMLVWLLSVDVLRLRSVSLDSTLERPMVRGESPAESLLKLLPFNGKQTCIIPKLNFFNSDSPLNLTRVTKWNLSGVKMELNTSVCECSHSLVGKLLSESSVSNSFRIS